MTLAFTILYISIVMMPDEIIIAMGNGRIIPNIFSNNTSGNEINIAMEKITNDNFLHLFL